MPLPKDKKIAKVSHRSNKCAIWTNNDINTLIALLKHYGTDFTLISTQMHKTRDQIKRKFKILEKTHPQIADDIFQNHSYANSQSLRPTMELEHNDFLDE